MEAKTDPLLGLKENVIIGKLVPAGTGLARYNDIEVEPSAQATAERMQALDTSVVTRARSRWITRCTLTATAALWLFRWVSTVVVGPRLRREG